MKRFLTLATAMGALAFMGCGDNQVKGANGVDGTNGADGDDGNSGTSTLVLTSAEPAGANCPAGGVRIETGADANDNGVLDADEVENTSFVCSGSDGQGFLTLVLTSTEPAGANCTTGGQRVDFGIDDNSDGTLDAAEIDGTSFVCDGDTGLTSLVATTPEAAGANCVSGGARIDHGVDDNSDGLLDAAEIDGTFFACNGLQTLVATAAEAAGGNCANAGTRIDFGVDDNGDGVLDAAEVDGFSFVCNGVDGINGLQTLVATTAEAAGANCADGGQRVDQGLDASRDGVLDPAEVANTTFVCNGANGFDSLILASTEAAGANCIAGGSRIDAGLDASADGVLDAGEITSTSFACNGVQSLVESSVVAAGGACGAVAGSQLDTGLDLNNDGALQAAEITTSTFVCGGIDGVDGIDGIDGDDGLASLVVQTAVAAGGVCGAATGVQIDTGLDSNSNTVLDAAEITATTTLCNGANGADGTNGTNGTNGLISLVRITAEPAGDNCSADGIFVESGLDTDSNGVLGAAEVTSSSFVCGAESGPAVQGSVLYGADSSSNGSPGNFYSINAANGEATLIGPLSDAVSAMAFDQNGVLFASSRTNNDLLTIDTATGQTTVVAPLGGSYSDFAFDPSTNTMFGGRSSQSGSQLVIIDLVTGAETLLGGNHNIGGIAVRDDGIMFQDSANGSGTVDKSTGALTNNGVGWQGSSCATFASDGKMYTNGNRDSCGGSGCLFRVLEIWDPVTGNGTAVGGGFGFQSGTNFLPGRMDAIAAPRFVDTGLVVNPSFESGDFTGWVTQDLTNPLTAIQVSAAAATDGAAGVLTGFGGDGAPGNDKIFVAQDIDLTGVASAALRFDWEVPSCDGSGGTLDRVFSLEIEPAGGGQSLFSRAIFSCIAGQTSSNPLVDNQSIDISSVAGQPIRIKFQWLVPEGSTGPAEAHLDDVRLLAP